MSLSNIVMYTLPIVVTPVLSRLYSPSDFGEWGVFSSFIAIITIALFLSYDNALMKAEGNKELSGITLLCSITSLLITALIAVVFLIGRYYSIPFISTFPSFILLIIYMLFYILYTTAYNICNKEKHYNCITVANVLQGAIQAVLRIIFGIIAIAVVNGLILGTSMALGICAVFISYSLYKLKEIRLERVSLAYIKSLAVKYKNFPLYDAPSGLLSFAAFNLPLLILSVYFDKEVIGCYSIILQLLLMPMSLIGSAIGRVYYQELCSNESDEENIYNKTKSVLNILVYISILPLLFLACGGDQLVVLFLGSKWHTAGIIALSLALWSFPTILTQPLLYIFRYVDKQNRLLYFDIAYFLGGIGAIIAGCWFSKDIITILLAYSVICACIKFLLFRQILSMSKISLADYKNTVLLWIVAVVILFIRLFLA